MRDFNTKTDNTAPASSGLLTAAEDNVRFRELKTAVQTAGIALDPATGPDSSVNMLAESMARYASGAVMCSDGGAANTYVLSITGLFVAPKAYFHGMRVNFYPGYANGGSSTINAFGLGSKKFLDHLTSPMTGGEVIPTHEVEAEYDTSLDGGVGAFRLCPWSNVKLQALPIRNQPGGMGLYQGVVDSAHYLSSLVAGTNIDMTRDVGGNVVISAVQAVALPELRAQGAATAVPSGVLTKLSFAANPFNTISGLTFVNGTATVGPNGGGTFLIFGNSLTALINTTSGFNAELSISCSAGQFATVQFQPSSAPVGVVPTTAALVRLAAGDSAALYYYHNTGRAETVQATLSMTRISA